MAIEGIIEAAQAEVPLISEKPRWYVIHTYSGYESKVKANIEKIIENRGMQDLILQVEVPVQESVEVKNGRKKNVQHKVYPSYVLLNMVLNDETWYVVRNTRGVTSFVGPGSKPVPLSEAEIASMGIDLPRERIDLAIGETVRVIDGPFQDYIGAITEINESKKTVVVTLSLFGRETPLKMDFTQVEKTES
jgi:transcriptional antiterminator NusG